MNYLQGLPTSDLDLKKMGFKRLDITSAFAGSGRSGVVGALTHKKR
jgi:hypothetical protein